VPAASPRPPIETLVDATKLSAVSAEHPDALARPRQRARYLCGISSPATTKARLTREPLFGALEGHRFADVHAWCEALP
jgi:ATP-dependent DNA helicase RecQ